jgi:hypothetical protein
MGADREGDIASRPLRVLDAGFTVIADPDEGSISVNRRESLISARHA